MCLDNTCKITRRKGIGYKVMTNLGRGKYRPQIYWGDHKSLKTGEWVSDIRRTMIAPWPRIIRYDSGFHVFHSLSTARAWLKMGSYTPRLVIVRVQYEDAVAQGKQDNRSISVARRIKILGRVR